MPERVGHGFLVFLSGQMQQFHVPPVRGLLGMSGPQVVPRHSKTARRKHFLAVPVVGKRAWLSHQRIDDVTIIDRRQALADQTRHRLNQMTMMRNGNRFRGDPQIHQFSNETAGNGVGIRANRDGAAAAHPDAPNDIVCVQTLIGERLQVGLVVEVVFPAIAVGPFHKGLHKCHIVLAAVEVPASPQPESLIDAALQMSMGRFDVAVFVGAARIRAFGFAVIVGHQRRVTFRQFSATGMIADGRGQGITPMPLRNAAKFPEGLLDAGAERFERFRKAQADTFRIAVRQHAMKEQVVKPMPAHLDIQVIAVGEVTGRQPAGVVRLAEEHRLSRSVQTPPLADAPFKRSASGIGELPGVSFLEPLKQ